MIVSAFLFFSLGAFYVQLANLQLLHGTENNILARKFVSRQEFTVAPRGLIFDETYGDSDNTPLVKNIHYIDFVIYPARFKNRDEGMKYIAEFAAVMHRPLSDYQEIVNLSNWKMLVRKNEPATLISRMTRREHERLAEFNLITSNGDFVTNHLRYYTMGPALAHVTGYIGYPSRRDLELKLAQAYQVIGKDGVESQYDSSLRGTDGIRIRHRIIDTEEQIAESEQGNNLVLTINRELQGVAYRSLLRTGLRGTVIAMNPENGEIRALVSFPSFDPNIMSSGTTAQRGIHLEKVRKNEGFLNIATQARFPPASTFKPIVAISALESPDDGVTVDTRFTCNGKWVLKSTVHGVPPSEYFCWEHRGHGTNNLIGAIAQSCNVYFYQLGYRIGPTPIINYARAFNLDQKTGIDLPGEISGFIPDQRWKQITWSNRWYDGDTINLSVGQGFLEVTPMEMAVLYSALANGGKIYRPSLLKRVVDPVTGETIKQASPELIKEIPISPTTLSTVNSGLRAVVTSGTARSLGYPTGVVPIAGKTGTVQTKSNRKGRNHAWFAGYAPYGYESADPLVVVVFLEYGMGGGAMAAPIAGDLFRAAFSNWKERIIGTRDQPVAPPVEPSVPNADHAHQ